VYGVQLKQPVGDRKCHADCIFAVSAEAEGHLQTAGAGNAWPAPLEDVTQHSAGWKLRNASSVHHSLIPGSHTTADHNDIPVTNRFGRLFGIRASTVVLF